MGRSHTRTDDGTERRDDDHAGVGETNHVIEYTRGVSFPWLDTNLAGSALGATHRLEQATRDLRDRAAMMARLGFTAGEATRRLQARVAWDYEPSSPHGGPHARPSGLSDAAIGQLVTDTFARHAPR